MANHTTRQRSLAASADTPEASMDPTHKTQREINHTLTTAAAAKPHPPLPNPIIATSTVQTTSNHFSALLASLKWSNGRRHRHSQPRIDSHTQGRAMEISTISDSSDLQPRVKVEKSSKWSIWSKAKVKKKSLSEEPWEDIDAKDSNFKGKTEKKITEFSEKRNEKEESDGDDDNETKKTLVPVAAVSGCGRRRSFCSTQAELADFLRCNGAKVVSVDMPPFMQIHAVDRARKVRDSLEKFTSKALALTLKREFDGVYGPAWHCIVGTSFGSFVTHSVGGFMYFSMDHKLYILLFKTTVQRTY